MAVTVVVVVASHRLPRGTDRRRNPRPLPLRPLGAGQWVGLGAEPHASAVVLVLQPEPLRQQVAAAVLAVVVVVVGVVKTVVAVASVVAVVAVVVVVVVAVRRSTRRPDVPPCLQ